jgi:hypothetical protein
MAGGSIKKGSQRRRKVYQLFGSLFLVLQLAYFSSFLLSLFSPTSRSLSLPTLSSSLPITALYLTYAVAIALRAGDLPSERGEEFGLDYFALCAVTQLAHMATGSGWCFVSLLVLPLHTLYLLRAAFAGSPLLSAVSSTAEAQARNVTEASGGVGRSEKAAEKQRRQALLQQRRAKGFAPQRASVDYS